MMDAPIDRHPPATRGIAGAVSGVSEELRRFVLEQPYERATLLEFVRAASRREHPGARVLDVGAGTAPYRELFSHVEYITLDHESSPHKGIADIDIVTSAEAIPLDEASVDAVLLIQVLEHVPRPHAILTEIQRVLKHQGSLYLSAPLVWELHELPNDYYRFTPAGLEFLLAEAGFVEIDVRSRTDCFTTLAQLLRNIGSIMGSASDGLDEHRRMAADTLVNLSDQVAELASLDSRWVLPLGYEVTCRRP